MIIKINNERSVDTDTLTLDELQELKREIDVDVDKIELQMQIAKGRRAANGKYADPVWFAKANFALRRRKAIRQQLQDLIAFRNKELRIAHRNSASDMFVQVCKERMDRDLFLDIVEEARKRSEMTLLQLGKAVK